MRKLGYALGVGAVAMGMFCLTPPVQAEMYVAGQVGVNIPSSLSNVEYSAGGGHRGRERPLAAELPDVRW